MTIHFSLSDLRVFCVVADVGSLSRAAERVSLSVAAVSGKIKNLESTFEITLLERSNQGIALTPAGRRLLEHAGGLLESAALLTEDMAGYGEGAKGLIRIAANTTAITEFVPQRLASFLERYPKIDIALTEHPRGEVVRRVREGRADIGIYNHLVPAEDLDVLPFAQDRLTLIVSHKHAWSTKKEMTFTETLISNYVCLQPTAPQYLFLRQHAEALGQRLKNRIHVSSFDAMASLVAHYVGVAVLPQSAATRLAQHVPIAAIQLSDAWADNSLSLCVLSLTALPERTRQLVDALVMP